jgi:hypothetical protein
MSKTKTPVVQPWKRTPDNNLTKLHDGKRLVVFRRRNKFWWLIDDGMLNTVFAPQRIPHRARGPGRPRRTIGLIVC